MCDTKTLTTYKSVSLMPGTRCTVLASQNKTCIPALEIREHLGTKCGYNASLTHDWMGGAISLGGPKLLVT